MKNTGLKGYVYDFIVDYDTIAIDDILDIHKYVMKKMRLYKMLIFVKEIFVSAMMFFSCNLSNVNSLKFVSMSNKEYKIRPWKLNINSNELSFYPDNIKINKCSGNCNNINDPFAKLCVHDVVKYINLKVFNLRSRTSETRYIKLHETHKCKCRSDVSVCNNKQRWNGDKCRCECKLLIDLMKDLFGIPVIVNATVINHVILGSIYIMKTVNSEKKLVDKLVEECTETDIKLKWQEHL